MHMMQHPHYAAPHNPYAPMQSQGTAGQPAVKAEPIDSRFMLNPAAPYALPPLPGPVMNGARQLAPPHPGGQTGVISFPRPPQPQPQAPPAPTARTYVPPSNQPQQRIPQVDGPSESSGDEDSSPPPSQGFAPRTSHPSLPQPSASTSRSQGGDSEAINSDLDDSDTEGEEDAEEGAAGETDIVFCTYDKVGIS